MIYEDFAACVAEILAASDELGDGWRAGGNSPPAYIYKKSAQLVGADLVTCEYHVAYNLSYSVPMLCFNCWKSDGSLISAQDFWKYMDAPGEADFYSMLTQMEHPELKSPFLALHPCKTEEIIESFEGKSKNPVLSWLSIAGPTVRLRLLPGYFDLLK